MPSTTPDRIVGWLSSPTVAITIGLLLFVLLVSGALGFGNLLGGLLTVVWLVAVGLVLWLLYRFVVAVERIASAHERLAAAGSPASTGDSSARSEGDE